MAIGVSNSLVYSEGSGGSGFHNSEAVVAIRDFLQGQRSLSAQEVVDHLKQEPELKELYSLFAGVGEGYSVEEHTRMVVESFEKEFMERSDIQMILQRGGLSPQEFILFLALHDIGKGRAVEKIYWLCSQRKELELRYTQEMIQKVADQYQLRKEAVAIFTQLLNDDAIGDLLKQRNPSGEHVAKAKEDVCLAARQCGVDDLAFLELKTLFHQVDAASYPLLRERFFQSDSLRMIQLGQSMVGWYIGYCQENIAKMGRLKSVLQEASSSRPVEMQEQRSLLSRLTFLHGSNSAALAMMTLQKEPKLQCFGELMAQGIAPMSGELGTGISIQGVNLTSISVETVRDIPRAVQYSSSFVSFSPDRLGFLKNPFVKFVSGLEFNDEFSGHCIEKLQTWRLQNREEFDAILSPGMLKNQQLVDALRYQISRLEKRNALWSLKGLSMFAEVGQKEVNGLKQGIEMLCGEREWGSCSGDLDISRFKELIANPYQHKQLSQECFWNQHTLQIMQMKQWDWQAVENVFLSCSDQWIQAVDKEKEAQEKPLKLLISMIDRDFSEEEKEFLRAYIDTNSSSSMPMPNSLLSIFPSTEDIPVSGHCDVSYAAVKEEMVGRRRGIRGWNGLLYRILTVKLDPRFPENLVHGVSAKEHLDKLRPLFEAELVGIEQSYHHFSRVLNDRSPPSIQIPADEEFRSLITKPFPVIFASTVVKAEPYFEGLNPGNPSFEGLTPNEYLLDKAVPLGSGGCDILFTDTLASQQKIRELLPQLRGVDIRPISELEANPKIVKLCQGAILG